MDFKQRIIDELQLTSLQADTMLKDYIEVCEKLAKEYHKLQFSENDIISSNQSFVFTELNKKYSNIEIVKICNETYYQANIKSKNGNLIAELFLYNEDKDFRLIKDNFPFPRKGYSFNLPVKTFEQLEYYLSTVGIDLIPI